MSLMKAMAGLTIRLTTMKSKKNPGVKPGKVLGERRKRRLMELPIGLIVSQNPPEPHPQFT